MEGEAIFRDTPLLSFLSNDILALAATCKAIFAHVSGKINNTLLFRYPGDNNSFHWYRPQHMRVGGYFGSQNIQQANTFHAEPITARHREFSFDLLPSTLTHLTFGPRFALTIRDQLQNLPLTHLIFSPDGKESYIGALPASITHIVLPMYEKVPNYPPNLTHITLGNCELIDGLPATLLELNIIPGGMFDQSIDNLPRTMTHLSLGHYFNHPITNLPPTLTHFSVGGDFNQNIDSLPESITHLRILRGDFAQPYTRLPPHLIELEIPVVPQDFQLPQSLNTLETRAQSYEILYPPNLKHLSLELSGDEDPRISLPASLESFVGISGLSDAYKFLSLPPNLKRFSFEVPCILPKTLPVSLQELSLELEFETANQVEDIFSLPNLTSLFLNVRLQKHTIEELRPLSLPPKLATLTLAGTDISFCNLVSKIDFCSAPLRSLSLSGPANIPHLPVSLTCLEVYNVLAWNKFPPNLKFLSTRFDSIRSNFPLPGLPLPELPPNLQNLAIYLPNESDELVLPALPKTLKKFTTINPITSASTQLPPFLTQLYLSTWPTLPPLPLTIESLNWQSCWWA